MVLLVESNPWCRMIVVDCVLKSQNSVKNAVLEGCKNWLMVVCPMTERSMKRRFPVERAITG